LTGEEHPGTPQIRMNYAKIRTHLLTDRNRHAGEHASASFWQ
jgi:hypothetical protein